MRKLTQVRLREVLDYDASTGVFVWKDREKEGWGNQYSKKIAGGLETKGYIRIKIDGECYRAHRLAWLFIHGYLPEHQIDHINGMKDDNRLVNLREVTHICNLQNQRIRKNNKSGITGVYWRKDVNKWCAGIRKNNKPIFLGCFVNLLDAAKARYKAEQRYFTCIVKSSALKYIEASEVD